MKKINVLVKGVPVPIHNMFKGFCSLRGKSVSEGIINAMISTIEQTSGGANDNVKAIMDEYQLAVKQKQFPPAGYSSVSMKLHSSP